MESPGGRFRIPGTPALSPSRGSAAWIYQLYQNTAQIRYRIVFPFCLIDVLSIARSPSYLFFLHISLYFYIYFYFFLTGYFLQFEILYLVPSFLSLTLTKSKIQQATKLSDTAAGLMVVSSVPRDIYHFDRGSVSVSTSDLALYKNPDSSPAIIFYTVL